MSESLEGVRGAFYWVGEVRRGGQKYIFWTFLWMGGLYGSVEIYFGLMGVDGHLLWVVGS